MIHPKQRSLYILFASCIFILLATFSIITYVSTASSIQYQLELKSDHILSTEFKEHFKKEKDGYHLYLANDNDSKSNQLYFITKNHKIIKQPEYDGTLIQNINQRLKSESEYQHRYMNLMNEHFFISSKKVKLYNKEVVYIYTIFETTESYHGLSQLKNVLIGLTIIYIFLILLMTYFFSKKAMAPLEYAVERQKQFVQDASHELKTPLAVIKAGTEVIEQFDGDALSDVGKEMMSDIKQEVNRMNLLVTDLLSLTRLDQPMQLDDIDLSTLLIESIAYFNRTTDLTIESNIVANSIIKGNAQKLQQAISILFENAIKYGNHPAVTITLSDKQLIFSDNGPGVKQEDLAHLFERFYRGDATKTGSGIGLALFKEIMDQHQAIVSVKNDHGLKFIITFK
ncbi:sensor histidine kinase [Macrococcoides bohemicum]|uniref:sensor histidine kinase n=1 Tax=Macrococcoides bohemicum TaxID=1903056 RepID=UPI00165DDB99|nr:HAMP domain-containing sensor histidine kinase [Macrococcus bohemicus]MBC9875314.1 HAMP domain-containing histidine kinase [Macrococcus bohemicus]